MPRKKTNGKKNTKASSLKPKASTPKVSKLDLANIEKAEKDKALELALVPYTENLPYQRDRIVAECKFLNNRMGEAGFELGNRLILLREKEPQKDWLNLCEKDIGIGRSWAYTLMELARRFAEVPRIRESLGSVRRLMALNVSESELREAEKSGMLRGAPVDEIDRMTFDEIKKLARKQDKRIGDAKKQVDDLRKKNVDLERMVDEMQEGGVDDVAMNRFINESEKKLQGMLAMIESHNDVNVPKLNLMTRKRFVGFVATLRDQVDALCSEVYAAQGIHAADLVKDGVYEPPTNQA